MAQRFLRRDAISHSQPGWNRDDDRVAISTAVGTDQHAPNYQTFKDEDAGTPGSCHDWTLFDDRPHAADPRHRGSIGFGVASGDQINLPRGLPVVQRSMNWVRVAERFPVQIKLVDPPASLMRVGASAVVDIGYCA